MRSRLLRSLALALSLLPGAALAANYPYTASDSDPDFMTLTNTGSSYKTMLTLTSIVPSSLGLAINVGDGSSNQYVVGASTYLNSGDYSSIYGWDLDIQGYYGSNNYGADLWVSGGESSYNYGVYATATGNSYSNNYGVYGNAYVYGGGGFSAAGYFNGDVWATNYNWISDRKFKKDIQDLHGGLNTVMALKPRTYTMRTEEFKGKVGLTDGKKLGFIAQELETVLPELVKDAVAPAVLTPEEQKAHVKKDPTTYKSVDYVGVIPVLVAAMQEQQALIDKLTAKVAALEAGK